MNRIFTIILKITFDLLQYIAFEFMFHPLFDDTCIIIASI